MSIRSQHLGVAMPCLLLALMVPASPAAEGAVGTPPSATGAGAGPEGAAASVGAGANTSSKSLRSNSAGDSLPLPGFFGSSGPGLGTTTWPWQVGQLTTVPALRRAIPISWLQ